jgi:4-hydroxy-tetrahydrodipicolinate reductase
MSYGISILKRLLAAAARVIDSDTDVEIVELHHRRKRDCPSGTTYALARALDPAARVVPGRNEPDPGAGRGRVIRAHSLRLGGVVGEHRVYLAMGDEVLTVSHAALSREAFARGALRAIYFVAGKDRGMYSMEDLASV